MQCDRNNKRSRLEERSKGLAYEGNKEEEYRGIRKGEQILRINVCLVQTLTQFVSLQQQKWIGKYYSFQLPSL